MNFNELVNILENTNNCDNIIRIKAEEALKALENVDGFYSSLLQLVCDPTYNIRIKQSAVIILKNVIVKRWSIQSGKSCRISQYDRQIIRDNIFQAVINQNQHLLRVHLLEILLSIIKIDYPHDFSSLLPNIVVEIKSGDHNRMYGAIASLQKIAKAFQFRDEEKRAPIEIVTDETFPLLYEIISTLLQSDIKALTPILSHILYLICKIFYRISTLRIPLLFQNNVNIFNNWINVLIHVATMSIPNECLGDCANEYEVWKHPLFRAKKWSLRALYRIFSRFGRAAYVCDELKSFATQFFDTFAAKITDVLIQYLYNIKKGELCSPIMLHTIYRFFSADNALQTLCYTKDELETLDDNPHEFIRKDLDVLEEFVSPRLAGSNMIIDFVKSRTKYTLPIILNAIEHLLNEYQQQSIEQRNYALKDGVLRMMGSIRSFLISKNNESNQFEKPISNILLQHVAPEFTSNVTLMRARACESFGDFYKIEFDNNTTNALIQSIVQCLNDNKLNVQLKAIFCINRILKSEKKKLLLKPYVPQIVDCIFKLYKEIPNDEVVGVLAVLIENVGDDIIPYVDQLVHRLTDMVIQLAPIDDFDAAESAVMALRALQSIIDAISEHQELYERIEGIMQPMISGLLTEDGIEFLEETLTICTLLTWFPKNISPYMWSLFHKFLDLNLTWAKDYTINILPILDNFLKKGASQMLASKDPNYLQLLLIWCQNIMNDPIRNCDYDLIARVYISILYTFKDRMNEIVPSIFDLVLKKLKLLEQQPEAKVLLPCCDILSGLVYYNPQIFIALCEHRNATESVMNTWLSCLDIMHQLSFRSKQDMAVIGLCGIIKYAENNQIPDTLQLFLSNIIEQVHIMLISILKDDDYDNNDNDDDDDDDDDDFNEEHEFDDIDEENDVFDEDDIAEFETLQLQAGELATRNMNDLVEDAISTELDSIDPFIQFAATLETFSEKRKDIFNVYMTNLQSNNIQEQFQQLIQTATQRKMKKEQENLEDEQKRQHAQQYQ